MNVVSPDSRGQVDPTVYRNLISHLPELGIPIVPISFFPTFEFQAPPVNDYVLLDFMEPHGEVDRYRPFWNWVCDHPPKLHLKRELHKSEVTDKLKPVDWPCHVSIPPTVSKAEFDARQLQVFFNWGYSNNSRPLLHADIFKAITTHGIEVVSSFEELAARNPNFPARTWVSIHTHCSVRRPIEQIMEWQQKAKISVSLFGNGKKCFRMAEAPVGSIMALPGNDLAWSYDWQHGINCILLTDPIQTLLASSDDNLQHGMVMNDGTVIEGERCWLYDIYGYGQETIRKYYAPNYARDYVVTKIREVL